MLITYHERLIDGNEKYAYFPHHPDHGQRKLFRCLVFGDRLMVNNRYSRDLELFREFCGHVVSRLDHEAVAYRVVLSKSLRILSVLPISRSHESLKVSVDHKRKVLDLTPTLKLRTTFCSMIGKIGLWHTAYLHVCHERHPIVQLMFSRSVVETDETSFTYLNTVFV